MTIMTRLAGPLTAALALGLLAITPATAADPHAGHAKAAAAKPAVKPAVAKATKTAKPQAKMAMAPRAAAKKHDMHAMMRQHHGQGHHAEHHRHMMAMMAAHQGRGGHAMMMGGKMMHGRGGMDHCGD